MDKIHLSTMSKLLSSLVTNDQTTDFILQPLSKILGFNLFKPTRTNINQIENYFGSKIALYFLFLQYFTRKSKVIAIVGIIVHIIITRLFFDKNYQWYHLIRIAFSLYVVFWTCSFMQIWKRKQSMFGIRYGAENAASIVKDSGASNETSRTGFKGVYKRALWNNQMNHKYYTGSNRILPIIVSFIISILMLCVSIGFSLLILYIKSEIYKKSQPFDNKPSLKFFLGILPPFINYGIAKFLIHIHTMIAIKRTYIENWDTK